MFSGPPLPACPSLGPALWRDGLRRPCSWAGGVLVGPERARSGPILRGVCAHKSMRRVHARVCALCVCGCECPSVRPPPLFAFG